MSKQCAKQNISSYQLRLLCISPLVLSVALIDGPFNIMVIQRNIKLAAILCMEMKILHILNPGAIYLIRMKC
jgi:hypothetical protein